MDIYTVTIRHKDGTKTEKKIVEVIDMGDAIRTAERIMADEGYNKRDYRIDDVAVSGRQRCAND